MKKVLVVMVSLLILAGLFNWFSYKEPAVEVQIMEVQTIEFEGEKLVELYSIKILGTGKTVSEIYSMIGPEGPIKPYDLMCASRTLKNLGINEEYSYSYQKVLYPAWFHAPGTYVSEDTECSLVGDDLRGKYTNFQEIGS